MRGKRILIVTALLATAGLASTAAFAATPHAPAALAVAWRASSATPFTAPAALPNGVVTTAGNTATARNLAHGAVLWKTTLPDEPGGGVSLGAPTVSHGIVDSTMWVFAGMGTVAFAANSGKSTITVPPSMHVLIGQLVANATATARVHGWYGSNAGAWFELTLAGKEWFAAISETYTMPQPPSMAGARAYLAQLDTVQGYDPSQGCTQEPGVSMQLCKPTWQREISGAANTPAPAGTNRIAATDASGVVTMLDATNGKVVWATPTFHTALAVPAYSNNVVYTGGADGVLRAVNAATGKLVWKANAGAPITTAPTVANGVVYVATDNGRLVEFDANGCGAATCAPTAVGNASLPGKHAAGAPLVRNHVAVVAYGTQLVAFSV